MGTTYRHNDGRTVTRARPDARLEASPRWARVAPLAEPAAAEEPREEPQEPQAGSGEEPEPDALGAYEATTEGSED